MKDMEDIELVIKIPEAYYELVIKRCKDPVLLNAFKNGTPLPKGHGRLFDERDIVNGNYEVTGNRIYELEPIIEADKESEYKE